MRTIRCLWPILLAVLWFSPATSLAQQAAQPPDAWRARLDAALAAPALRGAALSVLIVDRVSGEPLYARTPERALIPASAQKLLTAVAALDAFGPGHRFETTIRTETGLDAHGATANLYVSGGGDASLTSEQWWRLAADLRARGLTHVSGDLVLDDGAFDRVRWHPSWEPVTARAYHGPVGALTANYGAFRVLITPAARSGLPAEVWIDPPVPYLHLENRAKTLNGKRSKLRVERLSAPGRERIIVSGQLKPGTEPQEVWRSVADPRAYAGAVLRLQLEANGIPVGGEVRFAPAPANASDLYVFEGHPIRHIVGLLLKYSSNMIAESLVKGVGRLEDESGPASWATGMDAVGRRLDALGVPLAGTKLADGSGLSRDNRVTAQVLVATLRAADERFAFGPELLAGLPIAAEDGTLEKRAPRAHARVRAKTGTLDGVTTLAGHARAADGRELVFALLVNGYRGGAERAIDAVDGFAEAMVLPASR
jgi:D-alanyl-D-alanine carboxypeptidase/D-alanyl-D-alanine-endopeptidase (penicillin-binding protein 4)